jgi:hypothetical protein
MTPSNSNSNDKLTIWLLTFLGVIMTSVGGFTAAHIVSQNDVMLDRISKMESTFAAQDVFIKDMERRIEELEQQEFLRKSH